MNTYSNDNINKLRQNARYVVRELGLLNDAYFDIGVTLAERHLLIELNTCIHPTIGDIAERLLLDKSTASRLIAKAVKKGYLNYSSDAKDKRKRCLQLTELGINVLNAFEPIAFDQTKEALLTLTPEEAEMVFKGISLYAQGLKNSRLRNKSPLSNVEKQANPILVQMKNLGYTLELFRPEHEQPFYEIFREVVDSGSQFPYECSSLEEFHRQFLGPKSEVYVCLSLSGEVVGGFYLRSNFPGRSSHIANAAYMIKSSCRGQGIGTLVIKASLHIAKSQGFQSMQFNMVLSQNRIAIDLYRKLGFSLAGTLPMAIRNPDGSFQDGLIMHRHLEDLS